jgi:hypothetical protein
MCGINGKIKIEDFISVFIETEVIINNYKLILEIN